MTGDQCLLSQLTVLRSTIYDSSRVLEDSVNPRGSQVDARVRSLLARVLEQSIEDVRSLPENIPLFGGRPLARFSLTGLELLTGIEQEFGVDIAADDLNLDSLQTIGTLVDYLSGRVHAT